MDYFINEIMGDIMSQVDENAYYFVGIFLSISYPEVLEELKNR